jgi:hypothetical protein
LTPLRTEEEESWDERRGNEASRDPEGGAERVRECGRERCMLLERQRGQRLNAVVEVGHVGRDRALQDDREHSRRDCAPIRWTALSALVARGVSSRASVLNAAAIDGMIVLPAPSPNTSNAATR